MNTVLDGLNRLSFTIAPVFYKLLFLSVAATCIGFVIMLIRRFADTKISPSWKYAMWLLVLAALTVPYRPHTEFALLDPVAEVQELSYRSEYGLLLENRHNSPSPEQGAMEQPAVSSGSKAKQEDIFLKSLIFDVAIPLLWLFGAIAMAFFMLISRILLMYRLKNHMHTSDLRSTALLQQCKTHLGIRCPVRLVTQDYIGSPALIGFVRPKIILPLYVHELEEESLRYILLHELSHYKRADMLLNNLLLVLQAVYWFNPLIWLLFRFLRQDMELANDASVIKQIGNENSKNYLRSLVEVLSRYNQTALTPKVLCMTDGRDNLERRIRMAKLGVYFKKNKLLTGIISIAVIGIAGTLFLTQSSSSRDTMRWAKNLSVSQVERIELLMLPSNENQRYRLFTADEFEDVVTLINKSRGSYIYNPEIISGGMASLYVTTKDGFRHTVSNNANKYLQIDGDSYKAGYNWLSSWEYTKGNAPLPEDFFPETNGDAATKETYEDVNNPNETKIQAFKGLELYIWKNSELTGNTEPYFTLLTGTNRNKDYQEIYDLDTAVSDIRTVGNMLSQYADGLYLYIYQLNETDFTKVQMSSYADELSKYMPDNNSISIGLYEVPLPSEVQKEEAFTFFVKPDESPQIIGEVAAIQWLNRFKDSNVPETIRISDYTIDSVTVMAVDMDENSADRYDYLVEVQYTITTATDSYSTPENGISGKGTFNGLFCKLPVKALQNGSYEILNAITGEGG